ncbi:hypothetical protein GCM10023220_30050 [Streptomyces ziwulingensis]|uniref:Uncharacterized protein n=1 Tax=Streptomyces ziwulingensis TaxID=1045501 RepID=A0ABP9BX02_9ACTN
MAVETDLVGGDVLHGGGQQLAQLVEELSFLGVDRHDTLLFLVHTSRTRAGRREDRPARVFRRGTGACRMHGDSLSEQPRR